MSSCRPAVDPTTMSKSAKWQSFSIRSVLGDQLRDDDDDDDDDDDREALRTRETLLRRSSDIVLLRRSGGGVDGNEAAAIELMAEEVVRRRSTKMDCGNGGGGDVGGVRWRDESSPPSSAHDEGRASFELRRQDGVLSSSWLSCSDGGTSTDPDRDEGMSISVCSDVDDEEDNDDAEVDIENLDPLDLQQHLQRHQQQQQLSDCSGGCGGKGPNVDNDRDDEVFCAVAAARKPAADRLGYVDAQVTEFEKISKDTTSNLPNGKAIGWLHCFTCK